MFVGRGRWKCGFMLFLTFFISIRFLINPSTIREESIKKGEKLN